MRIEQSGVQILGYRSSRTKIEAEPKRFEAYLRKEGWESIVRLRAERGETDKPGIEAYSRNAKAVLMAGDGPAPGFERVLGFAFEIVPERNPYRLRPGDELPVRLLLNGAPLSGAPIAAMNAAAPEEKVTTRTDAHGRARFHLDRAGQWMIRAVHIMPAPVEVGTDWESLWASLTFELSSPQ